MTLLLLCSFWAKVEGQETFNKRMRFGFEAAVLTSVLATDSCYYATGIIADTVPPFNTGNIFAKLDLAGEPLSVKTVKSTEKTYETWFKDLTPLPDGGFAVQGYTVDSTVKTLVVWYDSNGDTTMTREFFSPFYPGLSFIQPRGGFAPTADGGFVLFDAIGATGTTDLQLTRLDGQGEAVWTKLYQDSKWDRPQSMLIGPDGNIICGGIRTNENTVTSNYTYQCHIFQTDSEGNVEWEWLSHPDSLRDAANDMLLLEDGSLIVASGVGHEIESASVNKVWFDKYIFKLNPQREVEWELTFDTPEETARIWTSTLVEMSDGSGYVMGGTELGELPPPVYGNIYGWLGKVSPTGDSIWTRRYSYMLDQTYYNKIHDMKETNDGGLIIVGESLNESNGATYPQQAWLLKLDQYGCLVPGCEAGDTVVYDAVGQPVRPELRLAIHPNPTADYLNFQLRGPGSAGRDASFRITDAQGRMVREFAVGGKNETYIVPVWDWGSGVYFLQYVEDGEVRVTERFVVSG